MAAVFGGVAGFRCWRPCRSLQQPGRSADHRAAAVALCLINLVCLKFIVEEILALFNASQEMLHIGAAALRFFVASLPAMGFQIICANYFQAIGKPGYTLVFNLLRQVIILNAGGGYSAENAQPAGLLAGQTAWSGYTDRGIYATGGTAIKNVNGVKAGLSQTSLRE